MAVAKKRWELPEITTIFMKAYKYIIPTYEDKNKIIPPKDLMKIIERNKEERTKRPKAFWDEKTESLVVFLYSGEDGEPISGFFLKPSVNLSVEDINFAKAFSKVFNQDISLCGDVSRTDEIWRSLKNTQFLRAISRFTQFKSISVSRWIQAIENSMSITYEGKSVENIILLPYRFDNTLKKLKESYIKLKKTLTIEEALLQEKWIRAVIDGRKIALLGTKKNGGAINGFISILEVKNKKSHFPYVPHESLEGLQSVLDKNDIAFIAGRGGDIIILLGNGIVFNKTQGKWRYLNYNHFHQILVQFMDESVTNAIISMVLNLAFEKKGALVCIVKTKQCLKSLVLDYGKTEQINSILRKSAKGLDIKERAERQIISSAATIDGALILDINGKVLDVACMIGKTSEPQMEKLHIEEAKVFPGSRTTASWNASLFGLAIKVSSDGEIIVFSEGKKVWEIS